MTGLLATLVTGIGAYFLFVRRKADLATVAYGGALFYFLPLWYGEVMPLRRHQVLSIVPEVYWIAIGVFGTILVAGMVSDRLPSPTRRVADDRAPIYLSIAIAAFGMAVWHGQIFNLDKMETMPQIGYWYLLFQVSASLAVLSAVAARRSRMALAASAVLLLDVAVGFRFYAVLTFLAGSMILLRNDGRSRLVRYIPTYGAATLAFVIVLLFAHSLRYQVASAFAGNVGQVEQYEAPPIDTTDPMYDPRRRDIVPEAPTHNEAWADVGLRWAAAIPHILRRSEPFVTQSILNEVVRSGMSCSLREGLNTLLVLLPAPARLLGIKVARFEDELKPVLFQEIYYGIAGNIWAEMLCRFGWTGLIAFVVVFGAGLVAFSFFLPRVPGWAVAPIALAGVVWAFYLHRNDFAVTLGMLRHIAIATVVGWVASNLVRGLTARRGS